MKGTGNKSAFDPSFWRDRAMASSALLDMRRLTGEASSRTGRPISLMEVCGSHTMAIAASGLRRMLPEGLRMLSGPGCPVCVTAQGDLDMVLELAARPGVIIATFGDMLKVKGSSGFDLQTMREKGASVRIVYSPADAVSLALQERDRQVVFIGVGFETTAPVVAGAVLRAAEEKVSNFSVLPFFKLVPPALELLLKAPGHNISGFMLPGHVSAVIGLDPYRFVADKYSVPCVVTGFEPLDIVAGVNMLLRQIVSGRPSVESEYGRAVRTGGNPRAVEVMREVFSVTGARWRSIGLIEGSGLGFSRAFTEFDAAGRFGLSYREAPEPEGCLCGPILLGKASPSDCGLFGKACSPSHAVGP
ncbi:MAG TPA: hydrogenase formation protein HypD, partial [Elusimicrobiales bacterium]|nr:hydrogenase formation protein HypD [Elusimicrobiales bacterium]